jgi:hypothetical protein
MRPGPVRRGSGTSTIYTTLDYVSDMRLVRQAFGAFDLFGLLKQIRNGYAQSIGIIGFMPQ